MAKTLTDRATTMTPEFRVYLREKCLINPPPPPESAQMDEERIGAASLAALFVPKLIEMAIGGVATLLKQAGADKTLRAVGHEFTEFYLTDEKQALHVNKQIGCILGVYGTFGDQDGKPTHPEDKAVRKLEDAGLVPKNADVRIIFEGAISARPDDTAFFVDTRHFSVRDFIGDSGRGERGFVVTLAVATPGATTDGDTIAIGNIDFGMLKRGADVVPGGRPVDGYPRFRSNLMPWRQISQASKDAYDADVAAGKAVNRPYMPVTFALTISQTEEGHDLLLKLGELLEGAKKEAAAEISKLVLPEERAKTAAERAEAAEKLYEAELAAELAVREAQKAYDEGAAADKPALRVKLEMAKRKRDRAITLREAAGLPEREPVPSP